MTVPFNPSNQQYGTIPGMSGRPTLTLGMSGNQYTTLGRCIGYCRAILKFETGHNLTVAANPGPWTYTQATADAIKDVQAFFGQPVTGVCDAAAYAALDLCYWN